MKDRGKGTALPGRDHLHARLRTSVQCVMAATILAGVLGCEREWQTITCFELAGEDYDRQYYKPEYYHDYENRLEAQAYYLYASQDYREALECFRQLRDQLEQPKGAAMIGVVLTRLGDHEEAETWLRRGIEESGDSDWAWGAVIWHYCERKEYARAEEAAKTLTGMSASTSAWKALAHVRDLREQADLKAEWVRRLPWLVVIALPLLILAGWFWHNWRKGRGERARVAHVRRMEGELRRINARTAISIDQIKARLLEERARSSAAAFLHRLVVDGHLKTNDSSLRGIQGLVAIYRRSLEELDNLALDDREKTKRRAELEKTLKRMVRTVSGGA
ncbi:MAG: tetratricopeptide repeat protein [bacterium]|nr:tetratricopeptide repeat protein [bacterium]